MFHYHINCKLLSCIFLLGAITLNATNAVAAKHAPVKTEDAQDISKSTEKKIKLSADETALYVVDLHCKTCAKKIAGKLYSVKGVKRVRTNVKTDLVIITAQKNKKLDVMAIWKAAQKAGFPPKKLISPQGTYVVNPKTKAAQRLSDKTPASTKRG